MRDYARNQQNLMIIQHALSGPNLRYTALAALPDESLQLLRKENTQNTTRHPDGFKNGGLIYVNIRKLS
jgi:hypothetical protein